MKLNYTVSIIIPIINEIISLKKTLLIINKIQIKKRIYNHIFRKINK